MEVHQFHNHPMAHSPPLDLKFNFISAPTSPSRASEFYRDFDDFSDHEFAFHVSNNAKTSVSAEDLFDHGIIRSPMAHHQQNHRYSRAEPTVSLKSPLLTPVGSPKPDRRKSIWNSLTPKRKKHNTVKETKGNNNNYQERGRGWGPATSTSAQGRRVARSLSPTRPPPTPSLTAPAPAKSSRKWKLSNFLLFRSASEGRAADKDPMRKINSFYKRSSQEETKASNVRKGPPISAHERHYTMNKAVSEDMKKKTFLPYKQGILGRLAVNPTVHALAHGFGSLPNG